MLKHISFVGSYLVVSAALCMAAAPKIELVSVGPKNVLPDGSFDGVHVAIVGDRPQLVLVQQPLLWSVIALVRTPEGKLLAQNRAVTAIKETRADYYDRSGELTLTLDAAVSGAEELIVSLNFLNNPIALAKIKINPPDPSVTPGGSVTTSATRNWWGSNCGWTGLGFNRAAKASEEDVHLGGSWTAGYSTRPFYSIDSTIKIPVCSFKGLQLDVGGTAKTVEKPSLDPDSFSAFASLKPSEPFQASKSDWARIWSVKAGSEFSRKDEVRNFIFAGEYEWAYSHAVLDGGGQVSYSIGLDIAPGLEIGSNYRAPGGFRAGYGNIARLSPRSVAYLVVPMAGHRKSLTFRSTYNPRILLSAEPFQDNRIWVAHQTPFTSFAKGTRHSLSNELNVDLTSIASLTFKHEFGSLPPAFHIVDFRFTTGLTIAWKWKTK
jgi:hypothetical protein